METITLEFFDCGGTVHFRYYEKVTVGKNGYRLYYASGPVPAEIAVEGADAVKTYVDGEIQRIVGEKKERDRISDEKRRAVCEAISCDYQGILLQGRIIWRDDNIAVDLTHPVQGSETLAWGNSFAGAMAGRKAWIEPGILTTEAIECARRQLVEIYKRITSPVKDLVKKLNKE